MGTNYSFLETLKLTNYRNYSSLFLDFGRKSYIIEGNNGVGKTNILEAISLFSSNKGIRSAATADLVNNQSKYAVIETKISSNFGIINQLIKIESSDNNYKKIYITDNQNSNISSMEKYLKSIWITPQMDNFFLQESSFKRKFIDKLIVNIDNSHRKRLREYEKIVKERNKALYFGNETWLDLIEEKIAQYTVAITTIRQDFLTNINQRLLNNKKYPLFLSFEGVVETLFNTHKYSLPVEKEIISILKKNRNQDKERAQTQIGAHKSSLTAMDLTTHKKAQLMSTGEQKMLLIEIVLAFGDLLNDHNQQKPLLLLDEIHVHLDKNNIKNIVNMMLEVGSQVFITSAQKNIYKDIVDFEIMQI